MTPAIVSSTTRDNTKVTVAISVACPVWWHARKRPCYAWTGGAEQGVPTDHGCQRDPGHDGDHVCPCGARKRVLSASP